MDAVKKSLISLHLTVILLGGTALFSKLVPLSAADITLVRSVFACIALFAFLKLARNKITLNSKKDYTVAVGLGV
ncbi:MAG: EamA/RhaT family transporter, partial [Pseudomonadota bacterium]